MAEKLGLGVDCAGFNLSFLSRTFRASMQLSSIRISRGYIGIRDRKFNTVPQSGACAFVRLLPVVP